MASYTGKYLGVVVDNVDPEGQARVQVLVPDVLGGDGTAWAMPLAGAATTPAALGDEVTVTFEHGDADHPIWEPGQAPADSAANPKGDYGGRYRAVVIDNADPEGQGRLQVSVPETGADTLWAPAAPTRPPAIRRPSATRSGSSTRTATRPTPSG
jgi:hypothetical protein